VPGNSYIEIDLKDPSGAFKKLSETVQSASKLTLLIFYSPTCEHCQAEIPQLKPIWEQYKSKGLKIYAVAFDATSTEWYNFISQKGSSEWTNVFEYPDGAQFSYQYVVNYTPTYIYIDSQGKIVKRFPTFEDVKKDIPGLMK
jgi:thiol-disulfide isomerase/thioredoxin